MASISKRIGAPYCMMITFEIAPEDEAEFNDVYDNDHIPNIMKLDGVTEVIRFRDPGRNEKGYLVYSAHLLHDEGEPAPHARVAGAVRHGRWMPVIRPKVKSRTRRTGPVVARFTKT